MKHKILIIIAITIISLFVLIDPSFSQETKEKIIEDINKGLIDIYVIQVSYYLEFNQYSDSLDKLGIDPMAYKDYWDIRLYSFNEGFVAEAKGINPPVLGEVFNIDQGGVVVKTR
ncbi:MAG: hypothetical protein HZA13_07590 [Nitrospirae bacterium]|nr:hypothetical protein [Nitrospirota bacterium]